MSNYDVETRGGRAAKTTLLGILALAILIATSLGSLFIGIRYISLDDIILSFTNYDPNSIGQMIVQTLRLPRMIAGIVVGISFAVSGALMQGVTNNPMASPSILGINAGASFGLAVGMILFPYLTLNGSILFSFGGAALATLFILALAKRVPPTCFRRAWWRWSALPVCNAACFFSIGFFVFGPQMLIGLAATEYCHKNAAGTVMVKIPMETFPAGVQAQDLPLPSQPVFAMQPLALKPEEA